MTNSDLKSIYKSMGMLAAQVVKGKLESAGIPALLKYESYGQVLGLTVDGLGLVEVLVPAELAEDAEALITEDGDEAAGGASGAASAAEDDFAGDETPAEDEPGERDDQ